jgi:hypothetical protein
MSQGSSRPLIHGLEILIRPYRTVELRFDPVSLAPMRCSDDRRLLFDVVVVPAAAGPHERSRAVACSVRDVLWQRESDQCRSRADV